MRFLKIKDNFMMKSSVADPDPENPGLFEYMDPEKKPVYGSFMNKTRRLFFVKKV